MAITRRALVAGAAGAVALGCAGAGGGAPAPAGTLFRPTTLPALPRVAWRPGPRWFASAGGLYCPAPRTAGAALLPFAGDARDALSNQLTHFRELPRLLEAARALGTGVLYLVDYYEGRADLTPDNYCWNKGDYEVRADLGGADALRDGIAAVHAAGGRVLLYLEPFVVEKGSPRGVRSGRGWSIRTAEGYPDDPYPDAWKVCPAHPEVQAHFVAVAERLVRETGCDGFHLDSFGFQRGWACVEPAHGHPPGDAEVFEGGCKQLVERLAAAIGPERVVMVEGPRMPGLFRWASASQEWGVGALVDRWVVSAAGQVPVFTAGWSLDDLHQIVALGHRIALGGRYWAEAPAGSLVDWFDANVPRVVPDKADHRFRRFYAEDAFRALHRWRNAGIVLGRPVPNVDPVAPRRWDAPEAFESRDGLQQLLDRGRALAPEVDRAVGPGPLPAAADHVGAVVRARESVAPWLAGAVATLLPSPPDVSMVRFDGPGGVLVTAANVAGEPRVVEWPAGFAPRAEWVERGATVPEVPPHRVRLWTSGT